MARITISTTQLSSLDRVLRGVVRIARRLALVAVVAVVPIALLLRREEGFNALDAILTAVLLAPAAIVLFFAHGVLELASLPGRLRKIPGEGQERITELARIAGEARTASAKSAPFVLWRLRGTIGSLREVAGIALPLRVLTPGFLGLAALAALACVVLAGVGAISLLLLALG